MKNFGAKLLFPFCAVSIAAACIAGAVHSATCLYAQLSGEVEQTSSFFEPDPSRICTPVWSLYNPNTSEHIFTRQDTERHALSQAGWRDEGICFGSAQDQSVPVARFYNREAGEHLYTSSAQEQNLLLSQGWESEGTAFYAAPQSGKAVFRLVNPFSKKSLHHYTADSKELEALEALGWVNEGAAFSVLEPYHFFEDQQEGQTILRAVDSQGIPASGLIHLRDGTYYFDPEQNGKAAVGWQTIQLSWLDLPEQEASRALEETRFHGPESKQASLSESFQSRSDLLLSEIESAEDLSPEAAIQDLQQMIIRSEARVRADSKRQKALESESVTSESEFVSLFIIEESEPEEEVRLLESRKEDPQKTEGVQPEQEAEAAVECTLEVYFKPDGRLARGELELEDGIHYFHPKTGEHYRNAWVRFKDSKKTCFFDENGIRAAGTRTIQKKQWHFDEKTGALNYDLQSLLDRCTSYIRSHQLEGEDYSFGIRIPDTAQALFWNDHSQQSASVMKLFVMGAVMDQYEQYCHDYGKEAIDSSLYEMITISSNEAWTYLVSAAGEGDYGQGCEKINAWNEKHGYLETTKQPYAYQNFTSVKDCSKILEDIEKGTLKGSARMKELICQQAVAGRLLQGIPAEVPTGNKPGWLDNTENDTVIVWTDQGSYIISLLSTELKDLSNAQSIMKAVSEMTYRWMEENLFQVPEIRS